MTRPAIKRTRRNGTVRCAIYTRKSSEEGLEQEFNSLQAQREACEAFIDSQRHEGWVRLRAGYDDGGCSGATMERPALQQLLGLPFAPDRQSPGERHLERHHPEILIEFRAIVAATSLEENGSGASEEPALLG
jgi:Resolvase, N terminal domain